MIISKAEVIDRFDLQQNQAFQAFVNATGEEETIYFTTPFLGAVQGGMVGHVPSVGSIILCCIPEGSEDWYYIGTTFDKELNTDGPKMQDLGVSKSQRATDIGGGTGAGTGVPHRVVIQDEFGNGLGLYNEKRGKGDQNVKTELKSGKGKRLALIDSANTDYIILETAGVTGGKSRIIMGDDEPKADSIASDSVEIFSTGPQKYINHSSQTDVVVYNGGKELQLINKADGSNKSSTSHSGNVNIQSDNKDVNILTKNLAGGQGEGNIYIEALGTAAGQTIQIKVGGEGTIRIQAPDGKIEIDTGGDLHLNATGNINMAAGGDFSVDAGGAIHLRSGGEVGVDGTTTYLQSGKASPVAPTITQSENKYGSDGITTY